MERLGDGSLDIGFSGYDLFKESEINIQQQILVKKKYNFGNATLVIAIPDDWIDVQTLADLEEIAFEFKDKNVLLVDDSIVRGTTSREIVEMARSVGAKKVYFASAAPPIRFQNVYGIDMAATAELIAHQRSEEQIAEFIGADWLIYQNLEDLIESAQVGNPEIEKFETSVFDGKYICGSVTKDYLTNLESDRKDSNKKA